MVFVERSLLEGSSIEGWLFEFSSIRHLAIIVEADKREVKPMWEHIKAFPALESLEQVLGLPFCEDKWIFYVDQDICL